MEKALKHSIFLGQEQRPFKMPLLAFEKMWSMFAKLEEATEELVTEIYNHVLAEYCGVVTPTQEDLDYASIRMVKAGTAASTGGSKNTSNGRSFSTEFYKVLATTDVPDLILQMCKYDYEAAHKMYCEVDRDDALHMLDVYLLRLQQDQQLMLEAAVFGAGGDFGKGGSKADKEFDLSNESGAGMAALKSMF